MSRRDDTDTADDSEVRDPTWTVLLVLCAIAVVMFVCLVIMFGVGGVE
jgi:hypothetical protein